MGGLKGLEAALASLNTHLDTTNKFVGSTISVLNAGGGAFTAMTAAVNENVTALGKVADAEAKLAAARAREKADLQDIADRTAMHTRALGDASTAMIKTTADAAKWGESLGQGSKITGQATIELSGLNDKLKEAASDALNAADAFGNLASKFGEVSGQADSAAVALTGVAWEVRHATEATVTFDAGQKALIESLAKVSDQYGQTSLWVGHLIAQFEKGEVSIDDFRKQLATMLTGMNQLPAAFGFTAVEMNKLLTIIDNFKNTASGGWPVGTTTAPYSNPSNPLTGKP